MTESRKKEVAKVLDFLLFDTSEEAHTSRMGMLTPLERSIIKDVIKEAKR